MSSMHLDKRRTLQSGSKLNFRNSDKGNVTYTIQGELGRGGSCIVYDGSYVNNSGKKRKVRIKECYPYGISIERTSDNVLQTSEQNQTAFENCKKRFKESFDVLNGLFDYKELTNSIANSIDIYELNNTWYVVSTVMQGRTLLADETILLQKQIAKVKTLAKTIGKLHSQGFLYLDLKPANVFILDEVTDLVQLFDFDSLVKICDIAMLSKCPDFRISYSKGFAPIEQQRSEIRKLGKYTDVYALGAILYYLIFGKTPTAIDSEQGAVYDFRNSLYAEKNYSPKLYELLTDFFHKTIASFYMDRYQNMGEVHDILCKLEELADEKAPYIISTPVFSPGELAGREDEYRWIEENMDSVQNKLVVAGMAGIGKSALVKKYVSNHKNQFDYIIYMYQIGSLYETFADDNQVQINGLYRYPEETTEEYGARKIKALYELTLDTNTIIVVDDYSHDYETKDSVEWQEQFAEVIKLSCKMLFITRCLDSFAYPKCNFLLLEGIRDRKEIYHLLEIHMGRAIHKEEYIFADRIIEEAGCHTLAIELIGKQIANSCISLKEASELSKEYGFFSVAAERVHHMTGELMAYETVKEILSVLYDKGRFRKESIAILKCLAFFGHVGVDVHLFQDMLGLNTKDEINILSNIGMVERNGIFVSLHPVIAASVSSWGWDGHSMESALSVIRYVYGILKSLGKKEEHPRNLLYTTDSDDESKMDSYEEDGYIRDSILDDILNEQMADYEVLIRNSAVMDMYMNFARGIVKVCNREETIYQTNAYKELLYTAIINTKVDKASFVFANVKQLLNDTDGAKVHALVKLCDYTAHLCEEAGEYNEAYYYLQRADMISQKEKVDKDYVRGIFYEMAWDYYDFVLDGDYFGDNAKHQMHLKKYNEAMRKAITYMKKSKNPKSKVTLARYAVSYVVSLIRNVPEKKRKIDKEFARAKKLIDKYVSADSEIREFYYMARGWYYTYVVPNPYKVDEMFRMALEQSEHTDISDLDMIENIISPAANMFMELGLFDRSADLLDMAIYICDERNEEVAYLRKRQEMYSHLWDVVRVMESQERKGDVIERMVEADEECKIYGIKTLHRSEDL